MLIHDHEIDGPRKHRIVEFAKPAPGIAYGEVAAENSYINVRALAPGTFRTRTKEHGCLDAWICAKHAAHLRKDAWRNTRLASATLL